ncbi:MAG: translation initiation factor IF-2 [bacterium]|nr:translation initiation factor IF-2 [bacterium]
MMSVLEYATDMNKIDEEVIKVCQELELPITTKDDILDEDMIVMLDNYFMENEEEINNEIDEEEQKKIEQEEYFVMEEEQVTLSPKKSVNKNLSKKEDYAKLKKEMYKHKNKFKNNNIVEDDAVLYKKNMTVGELASGLNKSPTEIIKKLMNLGLMLSINSSIDFDTAEIITSEYNKKLKMEESIDESNFEEFISLDKSEDLVSRPPVVTIMGHVDHGKTTLLDAIRQSDVAYHEAGGITQRIDAYQIEYNNKKITFIDTPGHAAFTEMRARGAAITDIVIIIVAADDGVMPQTKEVIDHALVAKVPIIVAINKIDKPGANIDKIMSDMSASGITPEAWGGKSMFIQISAKNKVGIEELLDAILLESEMLELKANPNRYATGTVVEASVDKKQGVTATILIQNGTLRIGDNIVVGTNYGKVRTIKNEMEEDLVEAYPSMPVTITGLSNAPSAGDKFVVFENEKRARNVAEIRKNRQQQNNTIVSEPITLEDLFSKINSGTKEINVVLKADIKGSEEAVKSSLQKIDVEGAKVKVVRSSVGAITESDIVLAAAANAIIIGFNVRPDSKIINYAKEKKVELKLYDIIYKVVEEMEAAMKGILDPEYVEQVLGTAEVRKIFKFSKVGTIAGCYVLEGTIKKDSKARIIRDSVVIYDGKINSLAREKDQVKEVKQGLECGLTIENYNDIKEQDVIEVYEMQLLK